MSISLSSESTLWLRLRSQHLLSLNSETPPTPAGVLRDVFCVQAQDLPAARLSLRVRGDGLTEAQVEAARQESRSVVWTSSLRGTLHLTASENARWLIPLLAPAMIAGDRRRMEQLGWDEESARRGLDLLRQALSDRGPLIRAEIARLLQEKGLPAEGQAVPHLIFRASFEAILCLGPDRGKEHTYVSFLDWIGEPDTLPQEEALARLARRYLQAYAPASALDFAAWSGLKITQARQALAQLKEEQIEVDAAGTQAFLLREQLPWLDEPQDEKPVLRLLPRFDTYLLGYANRDLAVDRRYADRINRGGGMIAAVVLLDGRAVGIWTLQKKQKRLEIVIQPFEPLHVSLWPLIETEAAEIGRFLGMETVVIKS